MLRARPETLFQRLSLYETLGRSVSLYLSEMALFTKIAVVYLSAWIVTWNLILLPLLSTIMGGVQGEDFQDPFFLKRHVWEFVVMIVLYEIVSIAMEAVGRGALALALAHMYVGRRPDWIVCLQGGLQMAPALGQATLLADLAILMGCLLLIVPGMYVGVRVMILVPPIVVEKVNPWRGLTRSAELVKGHGAYVACFLLILGTTMAVPYIWIVPWLGNLDFGDSIFTIKGSILSGLPVLLLGPIQSCAQFVIYINLRVIQEGLTLEVLLNELSGVPSGGESSYSQVAVMEEEVEGSVALVAAV